MPIQLVEIETLPIATNPEGTAFEDQEFATLQITDLAGNVVARPRVPIADVDFGELTTEEMRTAIETDGPQTLAPLAITP